LDFFTIIDDSGGLEEKVSDFALSLMIVMGWKRRFRILPLSLMIVEG